MAWKRVSGGGLPVGGTAIADNTILRGDGTAGMQASGWTIDDNDDMAVGALGDKIILDADGDTFLYCSADDAFSIDVGGTTRFTIGNSIIDLFHSVDFNGNWFRLTEMAAPTGNANTAKVFAQDNGAGKTQLMVIFGSGAAQQLAIEP